MYYDEDTVLDLRLNILNPYVHKFVINESKYTHSGRPRSLNFDINKFLKFKNKIEYNIIDDLPGNLDPVNESDDSKKREDKTIINALKRENYQRNRLLDNIYKWNDDDIIIISDVDEIPNLEKFTKKKKFSFFIQKMFYYKFNLQHPTLQWIGSRACKKKDLISAQWLRNIKAKKYDFWRFDVLLSKKKYFNIDFIDNGGWHFTSIKKPKDIHFKLSNFLHHYEFEGTKITVDEMEKIVKEKKVLYDHSVDQRQNKWNSEITLKKVQNLDLPKYLTENFNKYKDWLD